MFCFKLKPVLSLLSLRKCVDVSAILFYFVFNPASCWGRRGSAIVINNTLEKERMQDTVDFKEKAFGTFGPGKILRTLHPSPMGRKKEGRVYL